MSYSINGLLTKSLEEKNGKYILAFPQCLYNDTEKVWIGFINEYTNKYHQLPTLNILTEKFPTFRTEAIDKEVPLQYVFDTIIPVAQERYLSSTIYERIAKNETVFSPQYLEQLMRDVTPRSTELLRIGDMTEEEILSKDKMFEFGKLAYWMTKLMGKLSTTDFVVISGMAKSSKTTLLSIIATSLYKQGYNVLIFNNELQQEFMAKKIISILKGFNPEVFRTLEYNEEHYRLVREFKEEMKKRTNQIFLHNRIKSTYDVINAYNDCDPKPDIILVDAFNNIGAKTSTTQSEHSMSQANIAQFFRDFINDHSVPIIATSQLNRGAVNNNKPGQDTMGGTSELVKQADVAITTSYWAQDPSKVDHPLAKEFRRDYPNTDIPFYFLNTMAHRHGISSSLAVYIHWKTMETLIAEPSLAIINEMNKIQERELDEENDE